MTEQELFQQWRNEARSPYHLLENLMAMNGVSDTIRHYVELIIRYAILEERETCAVLTETLTFGKGSDSLKEHLIAMAIRNRDKL